MDTRSESLQEAFIWVTEYLFPNWNSEGWIVRVHSEAAIYEWSQSFTMPDIKAISVAQEVLDMEDEDALKTVLAHHICLALVPSGEYDSEFVSMMEETAARADRLGHANLAEYIRSDYERYTYEEDGGS